ncbi:ABC transporter ATP-binding protein [Microbacterium sp. dk485]|uniref:ABC transporter ATP-binding protein n=1 Tax=Microbacterium TaxID=33882 RepID=UPI001073FD09|nr:MULTISPECIES: ABC transporter ATP-binding protein [Microbacterium]TFV84126.1 ABC transporter ATP-binding protein [Microbacterium sp. dk485]TXK16062.1 ABC transporter ATP-binding protein [Microbacterium wangchenii]
MSAYTDTVVSTESRPPLIEVERLRVILPTGPRSSVEAVRSVDLIVRDGERVGIVGESGSGKSITGRAIAGLLPTSPRVQVTGSLRIQGNEMLGAPASEWAEVRRRRVGMIFQDPMSFLNPTMRIGRQVAESIPADRIRKGSARREAVLGFLEQAGLDKPQQVAGSFPHELSGGMRQRVLVAIAIAKRPQLILADEPTTALDVTVQQRVLKTLDATVRDLDTSLILISHDLAVVAGMTDRVYVMYNGRIVEEGPTERVITDPQHSYTKALLRSVRSLTVRGEELYSMPRELRRSLNEEVSDAS